jgi:uncharacterized membrane protein
VCGRCTGIYLGGAVAAMILLASKGMAAGRIKHPAAARIVRRTLFVAAIPTLATLLFEWRTGTLPANWIRAATGVPLGAAVAWVIGSVADVK